MDWNPNMDEAPRTGEVFMIFSEGRIGLAFRDPREYEGLQFFATGAVIAGPDPYNSNRPSVAMSGHFLDAATHWLPLPPPPKDEV